ncbi:helix-turn-helix domain-containing protein [Sphingosinicella rhizophila]|uniref:XRE family transcriptional regulator n=1 Tax=Sphingosinicella rhizophila TaxID=3050082 RepID=A0ABU3Q5K8_9SPHN|nr:XRE family transcriptional regulator [Sphingosinicella sp. GR2756]MDT9598694.1 XRE family transcriptional regulator [Sphingosinicella sp. GR2756]
MADQSPPARPQAKPGAVLKRLRAERGWTLTEASRRTNLSISTLSKMENDKMALTLEKLLLISEAFDVDIARLFGSSPPEDRKSGGTARRSVAYGGQGKVIETPKGNYIYQAGDLLNKRIIPIIGEITVKSIEDYGEFMRHSGEEYVYVLQGTMDLYTDMYTPTRLTQGDAIYFDSGMGHAYIAVGDEPCRILSVCATSEMQLMSSHEEQTETDREAPSPKTAPSKR